MNDLTKAEKQALSTTLKFRIDKLKDIEERNDGTRIATVAREQIDALVSVALKLEL